MPGDPPTLPVEEGEFILSFHPSRRYMRYLKLYFWIGLAAVDVAIHLRYDTMWYVMTDRSLRCRRGIWVILEHTITFENVQNVYVQRGPVQQLFGISTIVVETAGAAEGEGENQFAAGNKAIMEGIDNPEEIRRLIMERVQRSKLAGLGDEGPSAPASGAWNAEHLSVLRQILKEARSA